MKKVIDILQELNSEPNTYHKEQILRKYCEQIIEECAGNFECSMEKCVEGEWYDEMYDDSDGDYVHPVLHRGSILEVKRKL